MKHLTRTEQFVQELTGCQSRLFAFIFAMVGAEETARDILQETNLVLWRKADEFCEGTNFGSWACRTAHFQVLAYWRSVGRDRHVYNDSFLNAMATASAAATANIDAKGAALRQCLAELGSSQRRLIDMRYASGATVESLAESLGIPPGAISSRLYRLRQLLRRCIRRQMNLEAT